MAAQSIENNPKPRKKRVRYRIPTYRKSDKILTNILSYKDNQPHIFRYRALHRIYEEIAYIVMRGQLRLPIGDFRLLQNGLVINFETEYGLYTFNYQAEIDGTQYLSIKQRLKLHIYLLRLLRQDIKLKKAMNILFKTIKTPGSLSPGEFCNV